MVETEQEYETGTLGCDAAGRLADALFEGWELGTVRDLATHSADAGWAGLTYTSDLVAFYDAHRDDLWELARDCADDMGESIQTIQGWSRNPSDVDDADSLATWFVWFAAEELSRRVCAELDGVES